MSPTLPRRVPRVPHRPSLTSGALAASLASGVPSASSLSSGPDRQPPGDPSARPFVAPQPTEPPGRAHPPRQPAPPPPQVAALTDFTHIDTIFLSTAHLATIHIKYNPAIPDPNRPSLPDPSATADIIDIARALFASQDEHQEHFILLTFNTQARPYGFKVMNSGTRTTLTVDPALVFSAALLLNAGSIIVMHNHPSGSPTPTREDIKLTHRLIIAGDIINVPVLDHLILCRRGPCVSLFDHHPELWD